MNGFEKRAVQIKQKIKQTVLEMLGEWEPRQIRIKDIAAKAEVSQVTIYNYFGSKEALLREVFKEFVAMLMEEYERVLTGDAPLKEKIEYIIFQKSRLKLPFTPSALKQLIEADPEINRFIQQQYEERAIPLITDFVQKGKQRGEISEKVSVQMVLLYVGMMTEQYEKMLDLVNQSEDPEAFTEDMIHVFFYGICGPQYQK
ncbi:TetR/AcrR family transcriptional regulator [Paenibacillus cellulositrophicus]|uniref:TetR/AcrR family transcriptional regulator n=1 Tax=Paenibacillus cellulositrophicus TaxID=562959 RepID=UPI0012674A36|nr:TetR/AcrR family transcriptional regulator [Paenibacillus cellulositrophicus]